MSPTPATETEFIERMGRLFEDSGGARITGRILGLLLVCEPGELSQPELVERLEVSKASVSTALARLVQLQLVERTTRPGDRRDYYRLREDAWAATIEARLAVIRRFRETAAYGLEALGGASPRRRARLNTLRRSYARVERAMAQALAELRASPRKPRKGTS